MRRAWGSTGPRHSRDDNIRTGGPVDEQMTLDFHRRKDDGERCRGEQHVTIKFDVSVLRDHDGNAKTVRAGDRFVIPAGFSGTWEVVEDCRKVYVIFEQARA